MGEKGGVVGGKIILQVAGHDELEKERNASIFTFVTNRFSMSYRQDFKIILKIQLVENKEVTLLVELNW